MGTKKVVINTCFGGFCISKECLTRLAQLGDLKAIKELEGLNGGSCVFNMYGYAYQYNEDKDRENPLLIQVIEDLGPKKAGGSCAHLKIVEIPDDVEYVIKEYDGDEHVAEVHRTWR